MNKPRQHAVEFFLEFPYLLSDSKKLSFLALVRVFLLFYVVDLVLVFVHSFVFVCDFVFAFVEMKMAMMMMMFTVMQSLLIKREKHSV